MGEEQENQATETRVGQRVLLVDDDVTTVWSIGRVLANAGYSVQTFLNGSDAIDALREREFDVLITDVLMPKVDGLTLMEWVRHNQPGLLSVVITAHVSPSFREISLERGALLFLEKPVNTPLLVNVLNHYTQGTSGGERPKAAKRLLQTMSEAVSSGTGGEVLVCSKDRVGRIYLSGDRVAWAHVARGTSTLSAELVAAAGLDRTDLNAAIEECKVSGKNFSETLIEWGLISTERMRVVLLRWIAKCVVEMSQWKDLQALFAPQKRSFAGTLSFSFEDVLAAINEVEEQAEAEVANNA